jgi:tetratricopeptide (TPR) repeat protein
MKHTRAVALLSSLSLAALIGAPATGQVPPLTLPQVSQKATVSQTIGLTDITISYHRPGVKGRQIWGGLVPYGEVWRAGANENTTISFSSPVKVEGQPLAAGTYGLHMIPNEGDWTIAFSTVSWAWGSFSYDPEEDALRVAVKPQPAPFKEWLAYDFEDPGPDSVKVVLRWEKLAVPFTVLVDTPAVVVANIRKELRGLPRFSWQGWNQAAAYCAREKVNLDEAMEWADRSIGVQEDFANLRTKAALLELKGDTGAAEKLRARALPLATEVELNAYGYQLLAQDKVAEAIEVFKKNVKDHPESWNVWDSLGEAYARQGDKASAMENYTHALGMAPQDQKERIEGILKHLKE